MKFNKQILKAAIQHQTNKLAEQLMPVKGGVPLTSEEEGLRDTYLSFRGCGSSEARASYKSKTEKRFKKDGRPLNPATFATDDDEYEYSPVILAAFVPIKNPNGHNYTIDRPAVFYGTGSDDVYSVGEGDNYMSRQKSSIRIADEDEIDEIIATVGAKILRRANLDEHDVFFVDTATDKDIKDAIAIVDAL